MSSETLKTVLSAEKEADAVIAAAVMEARRILAETESEGLNLLQKTILEATETALSIKSKADFEASNIKKEIGDQTATTCTILRQTAELKIQQAVQLVVESIVKT